MDLELVDLDLTESETKNKHCTISTTESDFFGHYLQHQNVFGYWTLLSNSTTCTHYVWIASTLKVKLNL